MSSILAQTWHNIELIIVDDCSTDDTLSVAREFQAMDDRVKVLSTPVNSGPYVARNIALEQATGLLVTVNDADDWSHPEKIAIQARHLLCNDGIIANTSAHSRLTEALMLHRRGTPGRYIFPNMSSLMFRRKEVLERAGFWDEVRFAADSEFKRRLAALFGEEVLVDLDTGPLSFPRQASGSLTGSAAFGYKGFLMGVRKEYAEVHRRHHQNTAAGALKYLPGQTVRPYPVPEPMWVRREKQPDGYRAFDVVIIGDFRLPAARHQATIREIEVNRQRGLRTGLVQMNHYDATLPKKVDESIRRMIDGDSVQMLVYGESIEASVLLIRHPEVFMVPQHYVPHIKARIARGITDGAERDLRRCARHAAEYIGKEIIWHPVSGAARQTINRSGIRLSAEDWTDYESKLKDWLIEDRPKT
ncbi:glycosyltransferase family 2 protein [Salinicoccus sp. CNSTN-B1]